MSFDPGKEKSICYVDGDVSEWTEDDLVSEQDGLSVSMKYDEKFIYFRIHKDGLQFEEEAIYLPIDTKQKTGSSYCENNGLLFDRAADFLLVLDGSSNSRLLVQERYDTLRSTYAQNVRGFDTYVKENQPEKNSPLFYLDIVSVANKICKGIKVRTVRIGIAIGQIAGFKSL